MLFKKSICLVGSILITSAAFAEEKKPETKTETETQSSKINLDVLGGVGYTYNSGIKFDDSKSSTDSKSMNGFNVNASALYSIMQTKIGAPVVGLGINYSRVTNVEDLDNIGSTSFSSKNTFSTVALVANGGFKFTPAPKLAIFTLANLGYGLYDNVNTNNTISEPGVSISQSVDFLFKNHFIYGASVVGMYEVVQNFSVGAGVTYNRHSLTIDKATIGSNSKTINQDASFNEVSANLMAAYSF